MPQMPEAKVKAAFRKAVLPACDWYSAPIAGIYGRAGCPDVILAARGRAFAVELKARPQDMPSLRQRAALAQMSAGGAFICLCVDAANLEASAAFVRGELRDPPLSALRWQL